MATFKSTDVTEKIDRLFKVIDEDGNGHLSYDEICQLVSRSLSTYTNIWQEDGSEPATNEEIKLDQEVAHQGVKEMNVNMPAYFSRYIFDKIGVPLDEEISLDQMREMLAGDENGLELLEMFCGEGAVDVV